MGKTESACESARAIVSMGASVSVWESNSESERALFPLVSKDERYSSVELRLAAFLHSHPEKSLRQIVVQPTITGPVSLVGSLLMITSILLSHAVGSSPILEFAESPLSSVLALCIYIVIFIRFGSAFREYYRDVDMLGVQFGSFDVDRAECHCCALGHPEVNGMPMPCDREILRRCIGTWFGSIEAFHHQVQSEVKEALVEQLTTQAGGMGAGVCRCSWRVATRTSHVDDCP